MIEFCHYYNICYTVFIQDRILDLLIAVEKFDLTSLQMLLQAGVDTGTR